MNEKKQGIKERPAEELGRHIIQWDPDISLCAGCGACEIVCSLIHEGVSGSRSRRIFFEHDSVQLMHKVYTCQQCLDHPCYNACPLKGKAMVIDPETNIVYVEEKECIGCARCVKACPFEPKRIQINRNKKAIKCDLCRGRENGPACIEYCQCLAIGMSDDSPPVPGVVVKV